MDPPKTPQELYIWLAVQFSVLAAVVVIVRWFRADLHQKYTDELGRMEQRHAAMTAEKDRLYAVLLAEKDKQLAKAEAEVAFLRERFYPSRRRDQSGPEEQP
jgi:heme exporter protein D